MTTKRSIDSDIEALSDEILSDLPSRDRISLLIEAVAEGNETQQELLVDTVPRYKYRSLDHRYTNRIEFVIMFSQLAIHNLTTTWLELQWTNTELELLMVWDIAVQAANDGIDETDTGTEMHLSEHVDTAEELEDYLAGTAAGLYVNYHTYRQFAEESLGVSLSTLFEFAPADGRILEFIDETFEQFEASLERARLHFEDLQAELEDGEDVESLSLDTLAELEAEYHGEVYDGLDDPDSILDGL